MTAITENTIAVGIDVGSENARVATYDKNLKHPVVCANHDGHRETKVMWEDEAVTTTGALKSFFEEKALGLASSAAHTKDLSVVTSISSDAKEGWAEILQQFGAVITEGAAVCLAFGVDASKCQTVLVLDGGASALKASIMEGTSGGLWVQKSYQTLDSVNGAAIVEPLAQSVAQQFEQKCRFPRGEVWQSKRARAKLLKACEASLSSFQRLTNVSIHVDGLYEGMDCNVSISKPKWEHLSSKLANQVKVFCGEYKDQVDTVLVCGNLHDWMMPILKGIFGPDKLRPASFDPSEAIALGCTIQAQLNMENQLENQADPTTRNPTLSVPCCPISIGLKDGATLISEGTPLPCQVETTVEPGKDVEIIQLTPSAKTLAKLEEVEATTTLQLQLTTHGRLRICVNGKDSVVIG